MTVGVVWQGKLSTTSRVSPTLLSCSIRFLCALQQYRSQARLLYLLSESLQYCHTPLVANCLFIENLIHVQYILLKTGTLQKALLAWLVYSICIVRHTEFMHDLNVWVGKVRNGECNKNCFPKSPDPFPGHGGV